MRGMRTLFLRVRARLRRRDGSPSSFAAIRGRGGALSRPADHPGHAIAARQMSGGFGGMLSIRVKGGERAAIATAARVELWKRATSLGGVESLIEHRACDRGAGHALPARPAAPVGRRWKTDRYPTPISTARYAPPMRDRAQRA